MANNSFAGIYLDHSSSNNIVENTITNNFYFGIGILVSSSNNNITANNIANTKYDAIWLDGASNHHIIGNNVTHSSRYGIYLAGASQNSIYHNNFIDNTQQVYIPTSGYANFWDDGYPSGGNYWSDYSETDGNQDGLGDSSYTLDADNKDNHPLMGSFKTFCAGTWNEVPYYVDVVSKSNVSSFSFTPDIHTLNFIVAGQSGTAGFCRVTIPKYLMSCDTAGEWMVRVGDSLYNNQTITPGVDDTYIYFTYTHSTKTVQIQSTGGVPENLQNTLLLILVIATAVLLTIKKNKKLKPNPHGS